MLLRYAAALAADQADGSRRGAALAHLVLLRAAALSPSAPEITEPVALRSYASASRYVQKFGLAEAVQMLADEERLLTSQLLTDRLAGNQWSGSPTPDEKTAASAALDRLNRQLAVSSNFMDGYLRSAVTLPLSPDDANATTLEDCCLALARCGLADDSDNATERMDECCKTWRQWLRDVAAGKIQLVTQAGAAPAATNKLRTGRIGSAYDWSRFGAIR